VCGEQRNPERNLLLRKEPRGGFDSVCLIKWHSVSRCWSETSRSRGWRTWWRWRFLRTWRWSWRRRTSKNCRSWRRWCRKRRRRRGRRRRVMQRRRIKDRRVDWYDEARFYARLHRLHRFKGRLRVSRTVHDVVCRSDGTRRWRRATGSDITAEGEKKSVSCLAGCCVVLLLKPEIKFWAWGIISVLHHQVHHLHLLMVMVVVVVVGGGGFLLCPIPQGGEHVEMHLTSDEFQQLTHSQRFLILFLFLLKDYEWHIYYKLNKCLVWALLRFSLF